MIDDVVLFSFNDSGYEKSNLEWKLGLVSKCLERKIEITFVSKISKTGNVTKSKLVRSIRDMSIIFSVEKLFINTNQHRESLLYSLFEQE